VTLPNATLFRFVGKHSSMLETLFVDLMLFVEGLVSP